MPEANLSFQNSAPPNRRTGIWTIVGAAAVIAVVGGTALYIRSRGAASPDEEHTTKGIAEATVIALTPRSMQETVELLGAIEPEPNAIASISSMVSGRILQMPFREGTAVRAGQTVVVLDPGESSGQLAQAQALAESSQAELRQAETAVGQEKLHALSTLQQAEAMQLAAHAQVSRTMSELKALQATGRADVEKANAAVATAQRDLERVKAGSRPQEIAAARAELAQSDAQRQNAASQERRMDRLYKEQVASLKQLEEAQSASRIAEAQYQASRQRLQLVEEGARKEDIAVAEAHVREAEKAKDSAQASLLNEASKQEELAAARAQEKSASALLDLARNGKQDVVQKELARLRAERCRARRDECRES